MQAVIMAGGDFRVTKRLEEIVALAELRVAADAGVATLVQLGYCPDIAVGDFDSVPAEHLADVAARGCVIHRHSPAKDASDAELAILAAVERGADDIAIMGVLGGPRLDHLLANVVLLALPALAERRVRILDDRHEVALVRDRIEFRGQPGDLVTLLPFGGEVRGVTTSGLQYPLEDATLPPGSSWGLSNVMMGCEAAVRITEGLLLAIHRHEDG